jgi:hypothetical protein
MNAQWLWQSLFAMIIFIPAWLAIGFFGRNYGISPDLFNVWYFLGAAIGAAIFGRTPVTSMVPSVGVVIAIFLTGLFIASSANLLLFRAVAGAPNPGLPIAVANAASLGVFFAAAILAHFAPRWFASVKMDGVSFLGVIVTLIGTSLIAWRR